ncbi:LysR family transcriptional regulator [Mameliella sediminis]|uniref:LysR family transcriptional regulator n=1 Tax=Mameliella sediminis TaxID=2836866 RepID=UPI001C45AD76|nr:LysR family transcriptional regulator [Mameliella sediminis]MBV7393910.1 LysR family transcriptional regulator [Mameliella sediminis]MBY6115856.1 LysR family transcriptional regulator [Antarctobacter heliothermus]MBY6145366.1 LysR family transcriptional regulator [Mameliella alba]MCA0955114.1 LysR family transcriptional regulator [Mameliella alba]
MRNLDVTTLRSFVAVAQSGGVTRAAGFLNLTQSAVSMQIKRLEEMLDLQLLDRSGRGVTLTPSGAQLLTYAQRIVDLNDEAYSRLTDKEWEGEIRLGVPVDIVYPVIPQVLSRMGRTHPRVKVQLFSSFTRVLKAQFARGEMDAILTTETGVDPGGETLLDVPVRWVGAPEGQVWRERPVRMAMARTCIFRDECMRRLDEAGIPWELAVDSDSETTIDASVSADLAITARLEGHLAPYLAYVEDAGLPDLGKMKINLYVGSGAKAYTLALCEDIRQSMSAL